MKKFTFTIVLAIAATTFIMAKGNSSQKETVQGKVLEMDHGKEKPLAMAYVYIENTTFCTYTDNNGNFTLPLPKGTKEIHISFMGLAAQKVSVGTNNELQCILLAKENLTGDL